MWQTFKKLRTSRSIVEHRGALQSAEALLGGLMIIIVWNLHPPQPSHREAGHVVPRVARPMTITQSTGSICCKYDGKYRQVNESILSYPVRPFSERSVSTECFSKQFVVWVEAYIGCWILIGLCCSWSVSVQPRNHLACSKGWMWPPWEVEFPDISRCYNSVQKGMWQYMTDIIEYNWVINYLQPRKTLADVDTPSSPSFIWFDPCRCLTALAMPSGGEDSWQVPFMQIHQICESSESSEYRCLHWLAIGLLWFCDVWWVVC